MASFNFGNSNLSELEIDLDSILKPLQPRPEFVSELYQNILIYPRWKIAIPSILKLSLIIFAASMSGILIIVTGVRTIFLILATYKLFRNEKSHGKRTV
jgi:hypothetical protein